MIVVSSCLLGFQCRYDGIEKMDKAVMTYLKDKAFIPVCPEQMGGLETPRAPAEIVSMNPLLIKNDQGGDVTEEFQLGVSEGLKLLELYPIKKAILKAKSPSCGCRSRYDGQFARTLISGEGIFAKALREKGIKVVNETMLEEL